MSISTPSYFDEVIDAAESPTPPEVSSEPEETITLEEETLLTRGYLSTTVKIGNSNIVIRTLKIGEELQAALIANKYRDTIEASRALIAATIAAAVVSVDNKPLLQGLGPKDETLEARFNFIVDN